MRWCTPRLGPALLTVAGAVALSGCGSTTSPGSEPATTPLASQLVGHGMIMQSSPEARVELCLGPVATSYPPQCTGPALRGAFSWEDVEVVEQGGVRWTDRSYYAVGTLDRESDEFTLDRPLSSQPPAEFVRPSPPEVDAFPQLCDDPFRGGDPMFTDALEAQERLQRHLETMDGYVAAWVSDGSDLFNVVVTGDPEAAHAALRELWPGGLCVVQRELPTAEAVASAQEVVSDRAAEIGLLSSAGLVSGVLEVQVVVADARTTERIRDLVSPWLAPDEVHITGELVPLSDER